MDLEPDMARFFSERKLCMELPDESDEEYLTRLKTQGKQSRTETLQTTGFEVEQDPRSIRPVFCTSSLVVVLIS